MDFSSRYAEYENEVLRERLEASKRVLRYALVSISQMTKGCPVSKAALKEMKSPER